MRQTDRRTLAVIVTSLGLTATLVAGLDTACVEALAAPPFFLTPAGGAP